MPFSPSYTSLLDLYCSPLAIRSPRPVSIVSGFHLPEGHPSALSPLFWVSRCHPSPDSPDLPSQGRGTAGSCLCRRGLFRQLELQPRFWARVCGGRSRPSPAGASCIFWKC